MKSKKFFGQWEGPLVLMARMSDVRYKWSMVSNPSKVKFLHFDRIKRYVEETVRPDEATARKRPTPYWSANFSDDPEIKMEDEANNREGFNHDPGPRPDLTKIILLRNRRTAELRVMSSMLALRWIEQNVTKYRESRAPTADSIHAIDYNRRLELFETACKVFSIPMEVRRALVLTHRNAITTVWKGVGGTSRDNTKAVESILEEDLAKNASLSLHKSFCMNRDSKVKGLPNQAKILQEESKRAYEQLKAWEEIVISSDDKEELASQITMSKVSGHSTSKTRGTN